MRRGRGSAAAQAALGRRALFEGGLGLALSSLALGRAAGGVGLTGCAAEITMADPPGPRWMFHSRIAGIDLSDPDAEHGRLFDAAVRQGASVIEGDSTLSDYLSDADFDLEVRRIDEHAKSCHARNLKLVWYYPSLEVITPDGEKPGVRSLYKDHPDWVQLDLERRPNVFYGSKEHWVDPFAESAWVCHNSGYRAYFFERIRKLARTELDGLWIDVPLFMDTVLRWTCLNRACVDKFRSDTGMSVEALVEDWTDPVFRTWIQWRHEELTRFCMDVLAVAHAVKPGFEIVFETVTMDSDIATVQGLDASYRTFALSKPSSDTSSLVLPERVDRVWELDSVSNVFGMRPALAADWLCKIRGAKFARGCDRPRPSWVFSYGAEEPDAGLVMAVLCATGCNPYETKTPEMTTSVGGRFRTRMFQFIREHAELLFDAEPMPTVGVLHSSSSRDFVDRGPVDTTFFASAVNEADNPEVHEADPSFFWGSPLAKTTYCADYGGAVAALSRLHVPFAIVPLQTITADDSAYLGSFRLLVAPSLEHMSDFHVEMLVRFVAAGGHLLLTGPAPGHGDALGAPRADAARLDRRLGFDAAAGPAMMDRVTYLPELVGRTFLTSADEQALSVFEAAVAQAGARNISIDRVRHPDVHVELTKLGRRWILHVLSYGGAPSALAVKPADERGAGGYPFQDEYRIARHDVAIDVSLPDPVTRVTFLSPDPAFVPAEARWLGAGRLELPVFQYTIAVLET